MDLLVHDFIKIYSINSFFNLFIVIGIIGVCYALISVIKSIQPDNGMKYLYRYVPFILALIPLLGVSILQLYLMNFEGNDGYIVLRESNLQLVIIFFFLFMLDNKIQIFIEGILAVVIEYFYYSSDISNIRLWISFVGLISIMIISYIINIFSKKIIDNFKAYLIFMILFSASWWSILSLYYSKTNIYLFVALSIKFIVYMTIIHFLNVFARKSWINYTSLVNDVNKDFLTQVGNREAFDRTFSEVFEIYKASNGDLSFVMFDIDNFKHFNDTYGHTAGDIILKTVSKTAKETLIELGSSGQIFRLGGEEFGIIFRNKNLEEATNIAIIIGEKIKKANITYDNKNLTVTCSMGVSSYNYDVDKINFYNRVDSFLYFSKNNGKNAVTSNGKLIKIY